MLSHRVTVKRKAATWALGKMGPRAAAAIPELHRLKSDQTGGGTARYTVCPP
ncbi:MAG: hypothetical protein ACLP9L_18890 [Thermoguttaceae bacterium]